jgi:hypothetical protein
MTTPTCTQNGLPADTMKAGGVPTRKDDWPSWPGPMLSTTAEMVPLLLGMGRRRRHRQLGMYTWCEFVNGVSGFRVAGGSDEVQRNVIADRLLGLPRDAHYATPGSRSRRALSGRLHRVTAPSLLGP